MKKLIMMTAVAALAFSASAAYQVYNVQFNAKTTKATGSLVTDCGDTYNYRDIGTMKIKGVIAGCGCVAAIADGTCENELAIFWNETTKQQITDFDVQKILLQRIARKANKIEKVNFVRFGSTNDAWQCEFTYAGIGSYKAHKTDAEQDTMAVSGYFAGWMTAPYKKGKCSACVIEPDEITDAIAVCNCDCILSDESDITPCYGSFMMRYDSAKSRNCDKNGVTAKNLGLPSYVQLPVKN